MYNISIFTLLSNDQETYKVRKEKKVKLVEKIGEGSNSFVYKLDNDHVIKIYKNSIAGSTQLIESDSIMPSSNENREIQLFFKIIKYNIDEFGIVKPFCLGIINEDFILDDNNIKKGTYFSILPFYNKINRNILIKYNLCDLFNEIIESELIIEKYLQVYHLDIKIENLVQHNDKLMLIDYHLSKSINSGDMPVNTHHFNTDKNIKLKLIPLYYVFLLIISLLFNSKKIYYNNNVLINYLYILSKKMTSNTKCNMYSMIYNGISLKYDTLGFYRKYLFEKKRKIKNI